MSEENIKLARESFDAISRRDRAAWLALCDPDFEVVVPVSEWPEPAPPRGHEAAWDFLIAADEPWEPGDYGLDIVTAEGDKVAVHQRREMRGSASGVGVSYGYWLVLSVRDGKAVRAEWFSDRDVALEAAGLSE